MRIIVNQTLTKICTDILIVFCDILRMDLYFDVLILTMVNCLSILFILLLYRCNGSCKIIDILKFFTIYNALKTQKLESNSKNHNELNLHHQGLHRMTFCIVCRSLYHLKSAMNDIFVELFDMQDNRYHKFIIIYPLMHF